MGSETPSDHCWKCHIDVARTTSRSLCHSCCDALEDAGGRILAMVEDFAGLRDSLAWALGALGYEGPHRGDSYPAEENMERYREARALLSRINGREGA